MNRNRDKGHKYERKLVSQLKEIFPKVATSRAESKLMDNLGIDIVNTKPYGFQAKSVTGKIDYPALIERVGKTASIPIIAHQLTRKKGTRFYVQEEYAILKMEDFLNILKQIKNVAETGQDSEISR